MTETNIFKDKKILVTGGTGMIGKYLVEELLALGAKVRVASLDDPSRAAPKTEFLRTDLTSFDACLAACKGMEIVFHLAGIKGSPLMAAKKPASFFVPTLAFDTNMMEAARQCGVKKYLYTSSIGVYHPAEVFFEDSVWSTYPSQKDEFGGWAKRMGELQASAYRIEHGWKGISIARPANVYGRYDNFNPDNAMVIPSLIKRAVEGENPLVVWGDGSPIRDFIHASDVANGMLLLVAKGEERPVNLGSGNGVAIKTLVEIIAANLDKKPAIVWDSTKPSGDNKRVMDTSRAKSIGFAPRMSIEEGIKDAMAWYKANRASADKRYNVFTEKKLMSGKPGMK
ncbi:MAG: NAD-dependent epimerase/dehydratase family protein [Elusimicrobia bacterium]|nr:NAD-dependent epimerase/dehydratase family protein [Elusimicrobiota bacterium]